MTTKRESRKRPSAEIARVIRRHLKDGKLRSEIMEMESLTPAQYRWGLRTLGHFPKRNIEAFATFLADEAVRLEQISEDMHLARSAGDFRALAVFHKIVSEIKTQSMDLAMKLGLLEKAAEKLEVKDTTPVYEVRFGDESEGTAPKWPGQPAS